LPLLLRISWALWRIYLNRNGHGLKALFGRVLTGEWRYDDATDQGLAEDRPLEMMHTEYNSDERAVG
jgi:hypothetical protein